ncbi:MAG: ester cyclase [Sporichthyaceae bacterium]
MSDKGEDYRSLVRRLEQAMNSRRLEELDELLTEDFTRHCQATPDVVVGSRSEFKAFLRGFDTAFPDNVQTFTHIAVDGELIGVYATYAGTHDGPFGPIAATGKRVDFEFAGMFRVRDGKLAELRVTWDNLTVLRQLGLVE